MDPVAIATWHMALSNTVGMEVQHDLLALWLFPPGGGVVLLGPEELALDNLDIPSPAPQLTQDQLFELEERFRQAGYASAIAVPVRSSGRDVGLVLLGALRLGQFGPAQAIRLHAMVKELVQPLNHLALAGSGEATHSTLEPAMTAEALPEHIARVVAEVRSGRELVSRLSGALYPVIPHDRLEIVAAGPAAGTWSFMSGAPMRRRWGEHRASSTRSIEALIDLFRGEPTVAIADLEVGGETEAHWPVEPETRESRRLHSILGATLTVGGNRVGYLLLGSAADGLYRPADEQLLATIAQLVAPRATALRLSADADSLRAQVQALQSPAAQSSAVATMLATTAHLGEATREFVRLLRQAITFETAQFALRLAEREVVFFEPGDVRPLLDLPLVGMHETSVGPVVRGELSYVLQRQGEGEELIVPLRVAGRPVGALRLWGTDLDPEHPPVELAQQFADLLAPHLELLRRGALVARRGQPTKDRPIPTERRPALGETRE